MPNANKCNISDKPWVYTGRDYYSNICYAHYIITKLGFLNLDRY